MSAGGISSITCSVASLGSQMHEMEGQMDHRWQRLSHRWIRWRTYVVNQMEEVLPAVMNQSDRFVNEADPHELARTLEALATLGWQASPLFTALDRWFAASHDRVYEDTPYFGTYVQGIYNEGTLQDWITVVFAHAALGHVDKSPWMRMIEQNIWDGAGTTVERQPT